MPLAIPPLTAAPSVLLSQVGLGLALSVHLALGGLLLAGMLTASLAVFWRRGATDAWQLAGALATRLLPTRAFTLLLFLSAALVALLAQAAYRPDLAVFWWLPGLALLGVGLLGGEAWRRRLRVADGSDALLQGLALGSCLLLLGGYFHLFCMLSLLTMPGTWPVLDVLPQLLLSWSALFAWGQFLCLAFALCGALLLPSGGGAEVRERAGEGRQRLRLGTALLALFLAALPLPLVLELLVLPGPALSVAALVLAALRLTLAALILVVLLRFWTAPRPSRLRPVLIGGLVLLFGLLAVQGEVQRDRALAEHVPARAAGLRPTPVPVVQAEEPALGAAEPAVTAEAPVADRLARGRAVLETSCKGCHAFDRRLVGPPLAEVLPKYADQPERLAAFIADPLPVDSAYPPMPRLGLPADDIAAVSAYLLHRLNNPGEERP
ncbi:c-type cytochrome [Geoalkalibacter sp.]|uniref:c-type cytochrome n=1 Tax=Geoalkalibacter sp. TaxID=3041440 RepID=UPI00272E0D1C|nr:cytochrome c [Geoalkalibacter sp.]